MNCDNCGEEIGRTKIERPDGETWCYKCFKTEQRKPKNPKRAKSSDPFVKTARLLCDARRSEYSDPKYINVIMTRYRKRIYTNGYTLIAELIETPKAYKLIDVDNLWEIPADDRFEYPKIEEVLKDADLKVASMIIPEEFYNYARAFSKPKPRYCDVRVKICKDSIWIKDSRDTSEMFLCGVESIQEADFDYRYFMIMKPKEIIVNNDKIPARILSSYNESVDACTAAVLMPMKDEE